MPTWYFNSKEVKTRFHEQDLMSVHTKRIRHHHRNKRYVDGQNWVSNPSCPSQCPSKRSKVPPVNVTVMVMESFGVNRPLTLFKTCVVLTCLDLYETSCMVPGIVPQIWYKYHFFLVLYICRLNNGEQEDYVQWT